MIFTTTTTPLIRHVLQTDRPLRVLRTRVPLCKIPYPCSLTRHRTVRTNTNTVLQVIKRSPPCAYAPANTRLQRSNASDQPQPFSEPSFQATAVTREKKKSNPRGCSLSLLVSLDACQHRRVLPLSLCPMQCSVDNRYFVLLSTRLRPPSHWPP